MTAEHMTPSLSRAARAILNWSMEDLAAHTSVSSTSIRDYENGSRETTRVNRAAIAAAFIAAGIEFVGGEGQTPGLLVHRTELLNNPPPPKKGRRKRLKANNPEAQ
jgi:transcriptional regulator with XRE-family HTH domain